MAKQPKRKVRVLRSPDEYPCKQGWMEDTYLQCGEGLSLMDDMRVMDLDRAADVIQGQSRAPQVWYFEAFPGVTSNASQYIRGEGKTLEIAERRAWEEHERSIRCQHNWEAGKYTNGSGTCTICAGFRSKVFKEGER